MKTIFTKDPDVSWRNIEGQAVLLHNRFGEIQVLNEMGTYVWENLDKDLDTLAAEIAKNYEMPLEVVLTDLNEFLGTLVNSGSITISAM